VLEFCLADGTAHVLVTTEAECVSCTCQVKLIISSVRVMTLHAVALKNDAVYAARPFGHNGLMTLAADLVWLFLQKLPVRGSMGVVASGALARSDRGMYKLLFHYTLELVVTIKAPLTRGVRPQPEFILCLSLRVSDGIRQ
jgi:hypothetical protein